jgi:hypothetical protein
VSSDRAGKRWGRYKQPDPWLLKRTSQMEELNSREENVDVIRREKGRGGKG